MVSVGFVLNPVLHRTVDAEEGKDNQTIKHTGVLTIGN